MALSLAVFETAWTGTTDPLTLSVTSCLTGDYLFLICGSGHASNTAVTAITATTTVGSTGSWTEVFENLNSPANEPWIMAAWAQVTADGSVTVSVDPAKSATAIWGYSVIQARGSAGLGASGYVDTAATQAVSLTVSQDSAVFFTSFDWDAGTVGTGWTPTTDVTLIERSVPASNYTVHAAYWINQPAGTRNYGSTGAGGTKRKTVGLEILAAAVAAAPIIVMPPRRQ